MADYRPLWQDMRIGVQTGNFYVYKGGDSQTGTLVYSGHASLYPGSTGPAARAYVRLNDILYSNMDRVELPDFINTNQFVNAEFTTLFVAYDGPTQVRMSQRFINDWSYDYDFNYETEYKNISSPINGRFGQSQRLVYSVHGVSSLSVIIMYDDGDYETIQLFGTVSGGDFNNDFNGDFLIKSGSGGKTQDGIVFIDLDNYPGAVQATVRMTRTDGTETTETFTASDTCSRYVLYYLNAYGGWDFLLLEGTCTESDELTRHNSARDYSNTLSKNRGTFNFCNEIVKSWTLRTGWMTDRQSQRMHHVLNSTDVYLYDMETRLLLPVILTRTQTDYKTYKSEGNRLFNYEIAAQLAQQRQRR